MRIKTSICFFLLLLLSCSPALGDSEGIPLAAGENGPPGCQSPPCSESADGCPTASTGAPSWGVNMVNMNLYVLDTPLWYSTPVGPAVFCNLSYNSAEPATGHELFGNKWLFRYSSFLEVDSTTGIVTVTMATGRKLFYPANTSGGYDQPYKVNTPLVKLGDNHFELRFLDGRVYVYSHHVSAQLKTYVTEIRDAHGQSLSLSYSNDRLATITDAQTRATTLQYNAAGLVEQIQDPFGRAASFTYDADRNLASITDMGGYGTNLEYDAVSGLLTALVNNGGRTEFYTEPADRLGLIQDYPEPGSYMSDSHRITVTLADGSREEYYYNGNGGYGWYVAPEQYVEYYGPEKNNFFDAEKTIYQFTSTSKGYGEAISSISGPTGEKKILSIDYISGRITSVSDAAGNTTRYTYNDNGKVLTKTTPGDRVITYAYDANNIDLLTITTGLGTITNTYNAYHQLTSKTDRLDRTTTFQYNSYGQLTTVTDPLSVDTLFTYNSDQQLISTSREGAILSSATYDPVGRVLTSTDATGLTLTYGYDDLDHLTSVTYPDSRSETVEYASPAGPHLPTRIKDRAGRVTTREYDALGRMIMTVNPEGGTNRFNYDRNGNLQRFIDPNSNTTSFSYDAGNRLIGKTYADGRGESLTYDNTGLVHSRINGRGQETAYHYDEEYNLVSIAYSDDTPGVTFTYDQYNRLIGATDGLGSHALTYNVASELTAVDGPYDNDIVQYGYDLLGRRTSITPQGSSPLTYVYDGLSRLTEVGVGSADYTYGYPDIKSPLITSLTRPNGSVTGYTYDSLNRLTGVVNNDSAAGVINSYGYTYNNQDLRDTEEITGGLDPTALVDGLETFQYNQLNQLLSSTPPERLFTYDHDGNMLTGYTPEGYAFTATYDAEERLRTVSYTDAASVDHREDFTYRYDNLLGRIQEYESESLVKDTRIIRSSFLALQDRDSTDGIVREYGWGVDLGGGIGGLLNLRQAGADYSPLYDGKGNVVTVLDGSEVEAAEYKYSAFGRLTAKAGILDQPFQFSTKRYDQGTGLSYYGYRFYNAGIERWMNRDPIEEKGDINLYRFVQNNPIIKIDPAGLQSSQAQQASSLARRVIMLNKLKKLYEKEAKKFEEYKQCAKGSDETITDQVLAGRDPSDDDDEFYKRAKCAVDGAVALGTMAVATCNKYVLYGLGAIDTADEVKETIYENNNK